MFCGREYFSLYVSTFIFCILISGVYCLCPVGYQASKTGRCYSLIVSEESWQEARSNCSRSNGSLVTIGSELKKNDTVEFISAVRPQTLEKIWIGLINTRTEWSWINGGYLQPQGCYLLDDGGSGVSMFQHATGRSSSTYTPDRCVAECSSNNSVYSGLVRVSETEMECRCADSFKPNKSAVVPCTWPCPSNTRLYCGPNWGEDGEKRRVVLVFRNKGVSSGLNIWGRGQPNNLYPHYEPYQSCMTISNSSDTNDLRLSDESCAERVFNNSVPYSHICEYKMTEMNRTEAVQDCTGHSGHLVTLLQDTVTHYRCYTVHYESSLDWFNARGDCWLKRGDLLSVDVVEMYDSLSLVLSQYRERGVRWWVGGRDAVWTWVGGVGESLYSYWGLERPEYLSNDCAVMDHTSKPSEWRWVDQPCTAKYAFLCETAASSQALAASSQASATSSQASAVSSQASAVSSQASAVSSQASASSSQATAVSSHTYGSITDQAATTSYSNSVTVKSSSQISIKASSPATTSSLVSTSRLKPEDLISSFLSTATGLLTGSNTQYSTSPATTTASHRASESSVSHRASESSVSHGVSDSSVSHSVSDSQMSHDSTVSDRTGSPQAAQYSSQSGL